jgi:archaeosine synthase
VNVLLAHNVNTYESILSESIDALASGRLRWLVESTTHYSPAHASLLRRIDQSTYAFIEEFTPSTGAPVVPLIGPESYNAPAVRRFREYLADRYTPPSGKKIALLLPCSARKPYSDSKSHRRFLETIVASLGNTATSLSQIVLTSPLGLVPRELERVFPAANYDIPVTGDWDTEETRIAADALVTHLRKFSSDVVVVAHVSGGYLDIVKTAENHISQTIIYTSADSSPTGWESREALQETLSEMRDILSLKSSRPRELEEIVQATADFQFGPGAGAFLVPEHAKLGGKPYRQIVCRIGREQVCSLIANTGLLSLTLDGARRIASLGRYWVRLDAPFVKGGSVFAVGVKEADPAIRPGDEVIVLNNQNEVSAVGRSEMSGREMYELEWGRAVSIRHKMEGA